MRDKSLGIFLMALFGISGIALLVLAWVWPMSVSERIPATFAGSVGILVASVRARLLKPLPTRTGAAQVPVEVELKEKP